MRHLAACVTWSPPSSPRPARQRIVFRCSVRPCGGRPGFQTRLAQGQALQAHADPPGILSMRATFCLFSRVPQARHTDSPACRADLTRGAAGLFYRGRMPRLLPGTPESRAQCRCGILPHVRAIHRPASRAKPKRRQATALQRDNPSCTVLSAAPERPRPTRYGLLLLERNRRACYNRWRRERISTPKGDTKP